MIFGSVTGTIPPGPTSTGCTDPIVVPGAIAHGQKDPRALGSGRRHRRREDDGREGEDQADAGPSRRTRAHSFLSPFLVSAAVRDATSPVMSPAAVVFVTTIIFFSRAISVRVCSSRRRIADGAEP